MNELLARFLEQFRNKNASIDDFERLTSQVAGRNMRYFFAQWVEGTGVPEFSVDYQIIRTRTGKFRTRGTVRQNFENLHMPVELTLRSEGGDAQTKKLIFAGRSEDFDFESSGQPIAAEVDPNNKILRMSDDLRVSIVARRGIELFKEGQYAEAQQQLEVSAEAGSKQRLGLLQPRADLFRTEELATGARQFSGGHRFDQQQAHLDRSLGAHQTRQRLRCEGRSQQGRVRIQQGPANRQQLRQRPSRRQEIHRDSVRSEDSRGNSKGLAGKLMSREGADGNSPGRARG